MTWEYMNVVYVIIILMQVKASLRWEHGAMVAAVAPCYT